MKLTQEQLDEMLKAAYENGRHDGFEEAKALFYDSPTTRIETPFCCS